MVSHIVQLILTLSLACCGDDGDNNTVYDELGVRKVPRDEGCGACWYQLRFLPSTLVIPARGR